MSLDKQSKLKARHLLAMRLYIAGKDNLCISEQTGFSLSYVGSIVNSPAFQERYHRIQKSIEEVLVAEMVKRAVGDPVEEYLKSQAMASAEKLVQLRDSGQKEETQLKAAMDLLDRAGYSGKQKVEVEGSVSIPENVQAGLENAMQDIVRKAAGPTADLSGFVINTKGETGVGNSAGESPEHSSPSTC
jgi:membrane protein involved in colicin uptake